VVHQLTAGIEDTKGILLVLQLGVGAACLADLDDDEDCCSDNADLNQSGDDQADTDAGHQILCLVSERGNTAILIFAGGIGSISGTVLECVVEEVENVFVGAERRRRIRRSYVQAEVAGWVISGVITTAAVILLLKVLSAALIGDLPCIFNQIVIIVLVDKANDTTDDLEKGQKNNDDSNNNKNTTIHVAITENTQDRHNYEKNTKDHTHDHEAGESLDIKAVSKDGRVSKSDTAEDGDSETNQADKTQADAHEKLGEVTTCGKLLFNHFSGNLRHFFL